jgi:hypothetical protein
MGPRSQPAPASVGVVLVLAPVPRAPLLGLGKAKACFCLLVGALKLAQALRAGRPLPEGPRLVQLVTLAGVLSLCPQIVEVIGWHTHEYRARRHLPSSSHREPLPARAFSLRSGAATAATLLLLGYSDCPVRWVVSASLIAQPSRSMSCAAL